MALLRRLLEQDLKLEKDSLDPFKKFINKELDDVSTFKLIVYLLCITGKRSFDSFIG